MARSKNFTFDGGAATYFGTGILAFLLTVFTLGFGYPWALCMREQWRCRHTLIDGKRLRFTGGGASLIGLWIKWFIFLIITFGFYSFWLIPSLNRWIVEHTDFDDGSPLSPATVNVNVGVVPALGQQVAVQAERDDAPAKVRLSGTQRKMLVIGGIVLGVAVVSAAAFGDDITTGDKQHDQAQEGAPASPSSAPAQKYHKSDIKVQADLLWHRFYENEVETKDLVCGGKVVEITGIIKQVRESGKSRYVDFDVGTPRGEYIECRVQCKLKDGEEENLKGLETAELTLRGICEGRRGNHVIFTACEVGPFPDLEAIQAQIDAAIKDGSLLRLRPARKAVQQRGVPSEKVAAWLATVDPVIAAREVAVQKATDEAIVTVQAEYDAKDFTGAKQRLAEAVKLPEAIDMGEVLQALHDENVLASKIEQARKSAVHTATRKNGSTMTFDFNDLVLALAVSQVQIAREVSANRLQDVVALEVTCDLFNPSALNDKALICDALYANNAPTIVSGTISVEIDATKLKNGKVVFYKRSGIERQEDIPRLKPSRPTAVPPSESTLAKPVSDAPRPQAPKEQTPPAPVPTTPTTPSQPPEPPRQPEIPKVEAPQQPSKVETPQQPSSKTEQPQVPAQPTTQSPAHEAPAASSNKHTVTLANDSKLVLDFACVATNVRVTAARITHENEVANNKFVYLLVEYDLLNSTTPSITHPAVSSGVLLGKAGFVQFSINLTTLVGNEVKFTLKP